MSTLRKLAGQTAIYGLSSIVGRVLNYLLVPLYTNVFLPAEYGVVTELYAYVGFFVVLLTYGMETAFFRFIQKENKDRVYSTALISLMVSSVVFLVAVVFLRNPIAAALQYENNVEYITWFAFILALDAVSAIPFAKLRADDKAVKFAVIRFVNIAVNIGLNLFFIVLCPYLAKHSDPAWLNQVYDPQMGVGYIFISNLMASAVTWLILLPDVGRYLKFGLDFQVWKRMLTYALPLAIVGFAGVVNEMLDRTLLKHLLPYGNEENMAMIGIYGAVYKLSILMSLFNQAFRYAAEPFFFSQADRKDAKPMYARVLNYFTALGAFLFLFIMLFIDVIKYFIGPDYHGGLHVVPILLMANLFLGIQINLSIWFKLTDRTTVGAAISVIGATITVLLNVLWIPVLGYEGSAWATLVCYISMVIMTYLTGQRHYPIPYDLRKILAYLLTALGIFWFSDFLIEAMEFGIGYRKYTINALLTGAYLMLVYALNRKELKRDLLRSS